MSFVSSLPANLPKYGVPLTRDFARGREQYLRIAYSVDYAFGADRHIQKLPSADFATGLETVAVLLSQLDGAVASERFSMKLLVHDLSKAVETPFRHLVETPFRHLVETDDGSGEEFSFGVLAPKYFDLQTGKVTTEPTPSSVPIGIGGIAGCVVVANVKLCYKRFGDRLDWETLRNLLTAFQRIDLSVFAWLVIIHGGWANVIKKILSGEL